MQPAAVLVGENNEGGGPDRSLGQVADPRPMLPFEMFDKAVQLTRADPMGGRLIALLDQGKERRGALSGQGRDEQDRGVVQEFKPFRDLIEEFLLILLRGRIPFVYAQ